VLKTDLMDHLSNLSVGLPRLGMVRTADHGGGD